MEKIRNTIFVMAFVLLPFATVHGYSISDYDPEHRPSNLASAILHPPCTVRISEFDSKYTALSDRKEYWDSGQAAIDEQERLGPGYESLIAHMQDLTSIELRNRFHILQQEYTKHFTDCLATTQVEESNVPEIVEEKIENETQKLDDTELLKQQQLAQEQARKEAEAARKRQEEIDAAAARTLAEQAAEHSREVTEESLEKNEGDKPQNNEAAQTDATRSALETPAEKPSLFQRIKSFFWRWF